MSREQSILQKLKNKARDKRMPYQLVLQLFCQEEFLRRLSRTRYRDNFILKGGLFLFSYYGFEGRPTMDIDFLLRPAMKCQVEQSMKFLNVCQLYQMENRILIKAITSPANGTE